MFDVDGKFRSPREVCQLASGASDKLQDDVVGVLLGEMRDYKLRETLGKDPSYATAPIACSNGWKGASPRINGALAELEWPGQRGGYRTSTACSLALTGA